MLVKLIVKMLECIFIRYPEKKKLEYRLVRHDITSNCNLRCKFCVHDWKSININHNMEINTFSKIIEILPLVKNEGFYFSCRYEPTINPKLAELLDIVPISYKNKIFLTTNLAKPLSDEMIQRLKNSNLHHINISIETFNPNTYKYLCGGEFNNFYNNLTRLVTAFKESDNSPKLRYITMILKSNYDELIDIALRCHNEFFANNHEFRTPYYYSLNVIDTPWVETQILPRDQLNDLAAELKKLPVNTCCDMGTDEQSLKNFKEETNKIKDSKLNDYDPFAIKENHISMEEIRNLCHTEDFYDLRIESDGTVYFYGTQETFDINKIAKPYDFFKDKLNTLKELEASSYKNYKINKCPAQSSNMRITLDEFLDLDIYLFVRGWSIIENDNINNFEKILVVNNNPIMLFHSAYTVARPDVARYFNNNKYLNSGFECIIKKSDIKGNNFKIGIILKRKSVLKSKLYKEYDETLVFT